MAISESERKRNRDAQIKFRSTHPKYGKKYKDRQLRYYKREKAKRLGLAISSDIEIRPKLTKSDNHKKGVAIKYRKSYYKNLKIKVLTHYGGGKLSCVICGESRVDCLSIDHINGGGNDHRREILKTRYCSGTYNWLKKNSFPEGFQTLCMNCQFIKRVENKELIKNNRADFVVEKAQLSFLNNNDIATK